MYNIENAKKLEQKIKFEEILVLAKSNNVEFFTCFQDFYPEFTNNLLEKNNKLRISELTLCAYFYLGFTTKDIARYTFKSVNTVRNRRQNLRTKLSIPSQIDIQVWMMSLSKNKIVS